MSDVLHDEWDKAYEEGKEAGLSDAWSGEYTYRMLMDRVRDKAIRDCIAAVNADNLHNEDPSWDGTNWNNAVYACKEALLALLEKP